MEDAVNKAGVGLIRGEREWVLLRVVCTEGEVHTVGEREGDDTALWDTERRGEEEVEGLPLNDLLAPGELEEDWEREVEVETEGLLVWLGVPLGEAVALGHPVLVREVEGEPEPQRVADPVLEGVGVLVEVFVEDWERVEVGEVEEERVEEGLPDPDRLALPEREGEGEAEGDTVELADLVSLGEAEAHREGEEELLIDRVTLDEPVEEEQGDGEGDWEEESVDDMDCRALPVPLGVVDTLPVPVSEELVVGLWDTVPLVLDVLDRDRVPVTVGQLEGVMDRERVEHAVRVTLTDVVALTL